MSTHIWRKKVRVLYTGLIAAALWAGILLPPLASVSLAESAQSSKQQPGGLSYQKLEGRWVRPDGGYVLEVRTIKKDGSATAAYFNPRPVKVFRAQASVEGGRMHLFVELRDVNYPGSNYNLIYDPMTDRLKGTYFQAVEKLTFDIEFVRAKEKRERRE